MDDSLIGKGWGRLRQIIGQTVKIDLPTIMRDKRCIFELNTWQSCGAVWFM
jgi:hypothetical protein